jgi:hypothetical protein
MVTGASVSTESSTRAVDHAATALKRCVSLTTTVHFITLYYTVANALLMLLVLDLVCTNVLALVLPVSVASKELCDHFQSHNTLSSSLSVRCTRMRRNWQPAAVVSTAMFMLLLDLRTYFIYAGVLLLLMLHNYSWSVIDAWSILGLTWRSASF